MPVLGVVGGLSLPQPAQKPELKEYFVVGGSKYSIQDTVTTVNPQSNVVDATYVKEGTKSLSRGLAEGIKRALFPAGLMALAGFAMGAPLLTMLGVGFGVMDFLRGFTSAYNDTKKAQGALLKKAMPDGKEHLIFVYRGGDEKYHQADITDTAAGKKPDPSTIVNFAWAH